MSTYYIDPALLEGGDGTSPDNAAGDHRELHLLPGDTVLFKRGSFVRGTLSLVGGEAGRPITYGAYGEGEKPTFCLSDDVSSPGDWEETSPNVWRLLRMPEFDVGNFVFGENECTAALHWEKESLCRQGDFYDSGYGLGERHIECECREVLLYSVGNPGEVYSHVECVHYATRCVAVLTSYVVIENLRVMNSGVHGFAGSGREITVRSCEFLNIGGCAWEPSLRIRFGNAVELWSEGVDVTVEDCTFRNVYDSCVTHQGPGERTLPAVRFNTRGCVFDTYGMAAFEYRDKVPVDSVFEGNVCLNAGCGFAMLGEELPRRSEIWPQPMGHHLFLWRMDAATEGGRLTIRDNTFGSAPAGAAVYSIISLEAEAQITLESNRYTETDGAPLFVRYGGVDHKSFAEYVKAGYDRSGTLLGKDNAAE